MQSKQFHLGDVLTITTGCLVAPRGMEAVYDILNYMTGDNLFTHQLPRAADECKPHLLRQHPQLGSVTAGAMPEESVDGWLAERVLELGETLTVSPIPADDHEHKDPLAEMVEMRGGAEGIIPVVIDDSDESKA